MEFFLSRVTSIRFFSRRSAKLCRIALCLLVDRTSTSLQLLVMREVFSTPSPHLRHVLLVALHREYPLSRRRSSTDSKVCSTKAKQILRRSIDGSTEECSPATWAIRVRLPVDAENVGFWFWMVFIYLNSLHFSSQPTQGSRVVTPKQLVGLVQQLVVSHISCNEILKKRRVRHRNRSLDGNYALKFFWWLVLLVWSWYGMVWYGTVKIHPSLGWEPYLSIRVDCSRAEKERSFRSSDIVESQIDIKDSKFNVFTTKISRKCGH